MKFTLKEYQSEAVREVLQNLRDARDAYRRGRPGAFSLTAATGAGKTVMAAAAIEALFEGNEEFEFEADPGAVVLWFTDDPSLNEQTRARLCEASEIPGPRLRVIESTFQAEKLEPGTVYFLNAQKLSKNSMLVRSAPEGTDSLFAERDRPPPDLRARTMWDILRNTIEDRRLTLYLVLDEAHRGMKISRREQNEKLTTVQRLVNGAHATDMPPMPIVWGISATVERFDRAMAQAQGRIKYPNVVVSPARVQESGLLKDDIRLDFPTASGKFDTVLLGRAVRKIQEMTALWADYAGSQKPAAEAVLPLLVVQMPNTPSDELLMAAFETIRTNWPDLRPDALAHVFGERKSIEIGSHLVPHISPELVERSRHIRVLFAKDAISTGWDCPRAEVLVSFRPAQDETHITQLLGRMVRAPLARRIPGNDRLNSVECLLPHFNRDTAKGVVEVLLGRREGVEDEAGGTGGGEGRRVLASAIDMQPNPAIPSKVWEVFDGLPSQTLPRKVVKPMRRLLALAHALARDQILKGARHLALTDLSAILDGLMARHRAKIDEIVKRIQSVSGETLVVGLGRSDAEPRVEAFTEVADSRTVDADFKAAGRVLSRELAVKYADRIAVADEYDDGLYDAQCRIAALSQIESIAGELDAHADTAARAWLDKFRVEIKGLSDERREVYNDIRAMAATPARTEIARPAIRAENTLDDEGKLLDVAPLHLMSDSQGNFPIGALNNWERRVLADEMKRAGFLAWYRNPARASSDSLAVAYRDGTGAWRRMCPDFVFFHEISGRVRASVVDPHGHHLGDALAKLKGLAVFAAAFGEEFFRIEAISQVGEDLKVLDLKEQSVRRLLETASDAGSAYMGREARSY